MILEIMIVLIISLITELFCHHNIEYVAVDIKWCNNINAGENRGHYLVDEAGVQ